jgi:hypothetical protein
MNHPSHPESEVVAPFAAAFVVTSFSILIVGAPVLPAAGKEIFLREEFNDLERWKPLTFPRIERHSSYFIEEKGNERFLRAESDASASGIVLRETFPVGEYPRVRWRWKAGKVYEKGDARTRKGDDYPIRLYVIFPFDPDRAGIGERMKYGAARLLYGEYPPGSALNYIWANRKGRAKVIPNAFTGKAMMIVMRGPDEVGSWQVEEVDIVRDYREAFGEDPPATAGIAIMNDSDNTGESSVSHVDYLEISR